MMQTKEPMWPGRRINTIYRTVRCTPLTHHDSTLETKALFAICWAMGLSKGTRYGSVINSYRRALPSVKGSWSHSRKVNDMYHHHSNSCGCHIASVSSHAVPMVNAPWAGEGEGGVSCNMLVHSLASNKEY